MYYIIFSAYQKDKFSPGIIAKRYYEEKPTEKQRQFCDVFGFTILTEEEFNSIKTNRLIIL